MKINEYRTMVGSPWEETMAIAWQETELFGPFLPSIKTKASKKAPSLPPPLRERAFFRIFTVIEFSPPFVTISVILKLPHMNLTIDAKKNKIFFVSPYPTDRLFGNGPTKKKKNHYYLKMKTCFSCAKIYILQLEEFSVLP